jgi:hypothetical protein
MEPMTTTNDVWSAFNALWNDIDEETHFPTKLPLLAHYTTIQTLENIMRNEEVWFSNPLLMNDLEEIRFGMINSRNEIIQDTRLREALGSEKRHNDFVDFYNFKFHQFEENEAIDVYIFCLSEHDPSEKDGLLSMWRGYGADGKGAAIVFDASKILSNDGTPFVVAPVQYASTDERMHWINNTIGRLSDIIKNTKISDENVYLAAAAIFERVYLFSLFTKHRGFREEKEWRIAYLPSRDSNSIASEHISYHHGTNGLEPRLKLNVKKLGEKLNFPLSMEAIVQSVILGPHAASPISFAMVKRMLNAVGQKALADRTISSSIPYRSVVKG